MTLLSSRRASPGEADGASMRDATDFSQLPDGPVLNDDFCPSIMIFPTNHCVIIHPGSVDFIFWQTDVWLEH